MGSNYHMRQEFVVSAFLTRYYTRHCDDAVVPIDCQCGRRDFSAGKVGFNHPQCAL